MTYAVKMWDCAQLMRVLAKEVRSKHNVLDPYEVVSHHIEREFNVKIVYDPNALFDDSIEDPHIIFPSEAYYTMLLLKYL
jgi:hypothetical protein